MLIYNVVPGRGTEKKRIVWRCISRLEFGTKYCHDSPTMDEDKLHQAIPEGINEFIQTGQGIIDEMLDITSKVQQDQSIEGINPLTLRNRLDALTVQQTEFTEYDDTITRKYVEKITVLDAETIRIKFRYVDVEIDKAIRQ